eukprot:3083327-Pyramimonas_sp.AAC.1
MDRPVGRSQPRVSDAVVITYVMLHSALLRPPNCGPRPLENVRPLRARVVVPPAPPWEGGGGG